MAEDNDCAVTPIRDLADRALKMMAQGGSLRVMDVPGDSSFASATFSEDVAVEIARRSDLAQAPAPVRVKALQWQKTTSGTSKFPAWISDNGRIVDSLNFGCFLYRGGEYPTLESAKAAAQADYSARILSALEAPDAAPTSLQKVQTTPAAGVAELVEAAKMAKRWLDLDDDPEGPMLRRQEVFDALSAALALIAHNATEG